MNNVTPIQDELEPVLNLTPLVVAADTIKSYCIGNFEKCSDGCPLHNAHGKGCYFNNVTPDEWNISELMYEMTKEIEKGHNMKGKSHENRSNCPLLS